MTASSNRAPVNDEVGDEEGDREADAGHCAAAEYVGHVDAVGEPADAQAAPDRGGERDADGLAQDQPAARCPT